MLYQCPLNSLKAVSIFTAAKFAIRSRNKLGNEIVCKWICLKISQKVGKKQTKSKNKLSIGRFWVLVQLVTRIGAVEWRPREQDNKGRRRETELERQRNPVIFSPSFHVPPFLHNSTKSPVFGWNKINQRRKADDCTWTRQLTFYFDIFFPETTL